MYGSVIIVLLIMLSGLIAYLGDQIGMKLGKKRITLLGLRPRYSSIIITILTGILIAVLSITILLTVYSGLREALFNINEVVQKLERLDRELAQKDKELNKMKDNIQQKSRELSRLQNQKSLLETKLKNTEQEFEDAQNNLKQARADIESLQKNRDQLKNRVAELKDQRQSLESKVDNLNKKIDELTQDFEEAKSLANKWRADVSYFMKEDIVYQKGDVIYSDVIKGGQSEDKTIEALNQFLSRANEVAKEQPIRVDKETGMALELQTEDILYTARVLYNMQEGQKVIVSLVAGMNVPRNEWLRGNFVLNKNFVVFNQGKMIASSEFDADSPTSEIDQQLRDLLTKVNKKAKNNGLLLDNKGQVGSLDFMNFYNVLERIKSRQGRVEVRVYATEKIWRNDRIGSNIEFELVEPTSTTTTEEKEINDSNSNTSKSDSSSKGSG